MAKKETVKKTVTKKKTTKKVAVKKLETAENVVDNIDTSNATNSEVEKGLYIADESKLNEDNNNFVTEKEPETDGELKEQVIKHVASEILAEKNNDIDKVVNMPKELVVEKAKEKINEIKKLNNNRVNARIDGIFGYLWNGQEMDY